MRYSSLSGSRDINKTSSLFLFFSILLTISRGVAALRRRRRRFRPKHVMTSKTTEFVFDLFFWLFFVAKSGKIIVQKSHFIHFSANRWSLHDHFKIFLEDLFLFNMFYSMFCVIFLIKVWWITILFMF